MKNDLRYFLILNPAANQGRAAKIIPIIQEFFNKWDQKYELAVTKRPKEAVTLANQAAKKYDVVVAIGGDGTINEVVNGLMGSRAVFGLIPAGAGNDFSKALGLKNNLSENLEIILRGHVREVDVGKVNHLYFINILGTGFDALVAESMASRPKMLKGLAAYLWGLAKTLKRYRFTRLKLKTDGWSEEKEYLMVAAANGEFFGGGFHLTPHASIRDGFLDVLLADKMSRKYLLKNLNKVIKGTHENLPEIRIIKTKKLSIESEGELLCEYDGELLRGQKKLEIEILPRAIKIIGN
ncbi:MAG: diacylglycerol kinase family protein [Patescibacteria group bacterium]